MKNSDFYMDKGAGKFVRARSKNKDFALGFFAGSLVFGAAAIILLLAFFI